MTDKISDARRFRELPLKFSGTDDDDFCHAAKSPQPKFEFQSYIFADFHVLISQLVTLPTMQTMML